MGKRTGKPNSPISPWKARARAVRRAAAEERNKLYRSLTPQQRLANLDKLGLTAKRERARLLALIEKQKSQEAEKATPKSSGKTSEGSKTNKKS